MFRALAFGPIIFQNTQFFFQDVYGVYNPFFLFCDYIENVEPGSTSTTLPGPGGVGVTKALAGYARWMTQQVLPGCKFFSLLSLSDAADFTANTFLCSLRRVWLL